MPNISAKRFEFIGHALRGDGPFRPVVTDRGLNSVEVQLSGLSYLVRYSRESDAKFARRNQIAYYASPLARAAGRFVGYLSMKPPARELPNAQYIAIADDVDGKGKAVDVFFADFAVNAKARGSMLLLVDMPQSLPQNQAEQLRARGLPFWSPIVPEIVSDYAIGDDGRFDYVEFAGKWTSPEGEQKECTWRFTRDDWSASDKHGKPLASSPHALGECPVLIFTESGDFPCFGNFSAIAELARALFNRQSERDEILRAQTFSLLTMQVTEESTSEQKISAAQVAGETIGTSNLMVHSGSTPAFIAPPDGPARTYKETIAEVKAEIDEVALNVSTVNAQESGIAMRMRFQALNGELASFAMRLEDLERRAWELSRRWMQMQQSPSVNWPRDFNIADVVQELKVLADMQSAGMPAEVIAEQQKRIVGLQFGSLDVQRKDELIAAINERTLEPPPSGDNVVPLRPDPNAEVRGAIVRALGNASS